MKIFLISVQPINYQNEDKTLFEDVNNIITNDIKIMDYNLNLDDIDALIFTSKNAIKSMLYNSNKLNNYKWKTIDSFVFGESSAYYLEKMGGKIAYMQNKGSGNEFAKQLSVLLKHKKALYLRAKIVASNLYEILVSNNIDILEVIAYETQARRINLSLKPPPKSILIFSAPSTYRAFLDSFDWDNSYIAIALGDTTLNSFAKNVIAFKAPRQTIKSCIELAKSIQIKSV